MARLEAAGGTGTGFLIDERTVVTAQHVTEESPRVFVEFADGTFDSGTAVEHAELDLAIVQLSRPRPGLGLEWGDSPGARPGEEVSALGFPVRTTGEPTLTIGNISRLAELDDGVRYLQTDAALNVGNSGGPILDECGRVLAAATLKASRAEGIALGIVAELAAPAVEELIAQIAQANTQEQEAATQAAAAPPDFDGGRLVIDSVGIDTEFSIKRVEPDGTMPDPGGPDNIVYYDFSGWPGRGGVPGAGGNAVFGGYVVSIRNACEGGTVAPPCQAAFWGLEELAAGDQIEVHVGGSVLTYSVEMTELVDASSDSWQEILSFTDGEQITLIAPGGTYNTSTGRFSARLVVSGPRVE